MVECMHKIMFTNTWMAIQKVRLIFIFANEVTTMDFQSWLSVHVYLVDGTLEQLVNGGTTNNLTKVIVDNVLQYERLSKFDLVSKLISFGANGVLVF